MAVLEASYIYYIHMKNLWVVPTAVSVTDQTYTQLNVLCWLMYAMACKAIGYNWILSSFKICYKITLRIHTSRPDHWLVDLTCVLGGHGPQFQSGHWDRCGPIFLIQNPTEYGVTISTWEKTHPDASVGWAQAKKIWPDTSAGQAWASKKRWVSGPTKI